MPRLSFDTVESIPEGLGDHAKEEGGKYIVDVAPASKVTEFRDNNITLAKERDDLKSQVTKYSALVGEDPEKFSVELTGLRDVNRQVEDGQLKGNDAISKEVETRVASVKEGLESQLAEAAGKLAEMTGVAGEYKTKFEGSVMESLITSAVLNPDSGMNPQALPDILTRASGVFKVTQEGNIVPMRGETVIYGADGATPMTPAEWMPKLLSEAPYLGISHNGGGASGSTDGKIAGLSDEAFGKLSAREKLALAHKHNL